ncbi:MAG: hypothetical protein LBV45_05700, partial [Xanthomonadaceae bacterium]|nr:hypothetical protein [Xanthomonadaceae bacterium]
MDTRQKTGFETSLHNIVISASQRNDMAKRVLSDARSAKLEIFSNGDVILNGHTGTVWLSNIIDVSDIGFHFASISVRFSDHRFGAVVKIACGTRQKFDTSFSGDFDL